jgi:hypothetical protein
MRLPGSAGANNTATWQQTKLNSGSSAYVGKAIVYEFTASFEPIGGLSTGDTKTFFNYGSGGNSFRWMARYLGPSSFSLWAAWNTSFSSGQSELGALSLAPNKYTIVQDANGGAVRWFLNEVEIHSISQSRFGDGPGFPVSLIAIAFGFGGGAGFQAITFKDFKIYQPGVVAFAPLTLRQAVEALCARAGLPAGTYDASALDAITQPVRSMVIGNVSPTRGAMQQLMSAYFFDAVLSDKLYFTPRPTTPALTIPYAELSYGVSEASDQPLPLTVASDLELPAQIAVRYVNVEKDYQLGTEISDRLLSGQVAQQVVDLALGLTPAEAKAVADKLVVEGLAALTTTRLRLSYKYSRLQPGDVIQVIGATGTAYRFRLGRKNDDGAVIEFDAARDDASALISAAITDGNYTPSAAVTRASATEILALDIPLLRDADDGPGFYVPAKPTGETWPGAQVFGSVNDVDFTSVATIGERAVFGVTTTTLPNFTGGVVMDEVSRVTVNMGAGELSSTTRDGLFADEQINAILLGNEVVRFVTATLVTSEPNIYTLSRLLRGQRGTEWAMGAHTTGERAVLLRPQGMRRVVQQQSEVGALRYIKGVTSGQALSTAASLQFTNGGASQRPLAPVDVRAVRQGVGGPVRVTWRRRSRLSARLFGPVPLGEASESYRVRVFSGAAVIRTATVSSPEFVYTQAQQGGRRRALGDGLCGNGKKDRNQSRVQGSDQFK